MVDSICACVGLVINHFYHSLADIWVFMITRQRNSNQSTQVVYELSLNTSLRHEVIGKNGPCYNLYRINKVANKFSLEIRWSWRRGWIWRWGLFFWGLRWYISVVVAGILEWNVSILLCYQTVHLMVCKCQTIIENMLIILNSVYHCESCAIPNHCITCINSQSQV